MEFSHEKHTVQLNERLSAKQVCDWIQKTARRAALRKTERDEKACVLLLLSVLNDSSETKPGRSHCFLKQAALKLPKLVAIRLIWQTIPRFPAVLLWQSHRTADQLVIYHLYHPASWPVSPLICLIAKSYRVSLWIPLDSFAEERLTLNVHTHTHKVTPHGHASGGE